MRSPAACRIALFACAWCMHAFAGEAEAVGPEKIAQAIENMRNISMDALSDDEKEKKSTELQEAWKTLQAAGARGMTALKAEVRAVDEAGEKDHFFKLGAAALMAQIAKLDEAQAIADIWNGTPVHEQYNYVFYTAFDAARTQDMRALPMLQALLKDDKGTVFLSAHALKLKWPQTVSWVWSAFGPKGLPALKRTLAESKDPVEHEIALCVISDFLDSSALPDIRKIARSGAGPVRLRAIKALGSFGHPADFQLLADGLTSNDPEVLHACEYALYEYGDLRAAPSIIPLLAHREEKVWHEALAALVRLLSPEGLAAIERQARDVKDEKRQADFARTLDHVFKDILKTERSVWNRKTAEERRTAIRATRAEGRAAFAAPRAGDKKLSREDFKAAIAEYQQNHGLTCGTYKWVEPRHIIAIAAPGDIADLQEVRAKLFFRLSDECLYEVRDLDRVIRWLVRAQYRADPWETEKVAPGGARR
ncbi:MAG TPA: hypothetical protein DCM87_18400 [Planctomycetes bacterium]|nr:hypothetical protein [Planctomycetota bacterium]